MIIATAYQLTKHFLDTFINYFSFIFFSLSIFPTLQVCFQISDFLQLPV